MKQFFRPLVTFVVATLTFGMTLALFTVLVNMLTSSGGYFMMFLLSLVSGFLTGFAVPLFRSCHRPRLWLPIYSLLLFTLIGAVTVALAQWDAPAEVQRRLILIVLMAAAAVSGMFFGVSTLQYFRSPPKTGDRPTGDVE